jgi:hypothetical protein
MDENGGLMFDFIEITWGYARIPKGTIHRFWAQEGQFSAIANFEGRELPGTNFLPFWQTQRIAVADLISGYIITNTSQFDYLIFTGRTIPRSMSCSDFLRDSTISGTFRLELAVRPRDLSLEKALCA